MEGWKIVPSETTVSEVWGQWGQKTDGGVEALRPAVAILRTLRRAAVMQKTPGLSAALQRPLWRTGTTQITPGLSAALLPFVTNLLCW